MLIWTILPILTPNMTDIDTKSIDRYDTEILNHEKKGKATFGDEMGEQG